MHTKIKLKVDLYESSSKIDNDISKISYYLKITILDVDERFQVDDYTGDFLSFRGDSYYVKCHRNKKQGEMTDKGISLPKRDSCGFPHIMFFNSDKERKVYLKTLFMTLEDWSNYWWGFSKDSISKLNINDDICEIKSEFIKKVLYSVY